MPGFQCPYCSMMSPKTNDTFRTRVPSFDSDTPYVGSYYDSACELSFFYCPNCHQYTISVEGKGEKVKNLKMNIRPQSFAKQYPEYIPAAIRQDYEEACAIVDLSPKASATLSRRCLQGMIRDFWGINESNLHKAIEALKGKVPDIQWRVIDGVRKIGNIGAHMEKDINLIVDIEPSESEKLLKLIEHLLEQWYISRHEQQRLYNDIIEMDENMQSERREGER